MTSKQSLIRVFRNKLVLQFYEKQDSEKEKLVLFFQIQYFSIEKTTKLVFQFSKFVLSLENIF